MRRSGTSLTASVLRSIGFKFHDDARPSDKSNERGYLESRKSEVLNESILAYLGGNQDSPPGTPNGWEKGRRLGKILDACRSFISELQTAQLWGWKDNRLSITLPFWKPLLQRPVHFLVCVRNPLEVAYSWGKMDRKLDIARATKMWFTFTAQALKNTADEPTLVVFHEDYFPDSRWQVSKIANFVGQPYDVASSVADSKLRHQQISTSELLAHPLVPEKVKFLYCSLLLSKSDPQILAYLQKEFGSYSECFSPWRFRLQSRLRYYSSFGEGWLPKRIVANFLK